MDAQYNDGHLILYQYSPSDVAAGIFAGLFGVSAILHFFEMCRLRSIYFLPMIFGCVMEVFGYYGRFWGAHSDYQNFGAYCLQSFMLLLGPIFMAATMYMSLRRAAGFLDCSSLVAIRAACSSKLFILGDVVCFLVQIAGLGLRVTTDPGVQQTGRTVIIVGLVVQLLLTSGYLLLVWNFLARMSNLTAQHQPAVPWEKYPRLLIAASTCLILRNLVRLVEFGQGPNGFVATHEVFVYLFDGVPMVLSSTAMFVANPGYLRRQVKGWEKRSETLAEPMVEPRNTPDRV